MRVINGSATGINGSVIYGELLPYEHHRFEIHVKEDMQRGAGDAIVLTACDSPRAVNIVVRKGCGANQTNRQWPAKWNADFYSDRESDGVWCSGIGERDTGASSSGSGSSSMAGEVAGERPTLVLPGDELKKGCYEIDIYLRPEADGSVAPSHPGNNALMFMEAAQAQGSEPAYTPGSNTSAYALEVQCSGMRTSGDVNKVWPENTASDVSASTVPDQGVTTASGLQLPGVTRGCPGVPPGLQMVALTTPAAEVLSEFLKVPAFTVPEFYSGESCFGDRSDTCTVNWIELLGEMPHYVWTNGVPTEALYNNLTNGGRLNDDEVRASCPNLHSRVENADSLFHFSSVNVSGFPNLLQRNCQQNFFELLNGSSPSESSESTTNPSSPEPIESDDPRCQFPCGCLTLGKTTCPDDSPCGNGAAPPYVIIGPVTGLYMDNMEGPALPECTQCGVVNDTCAGGKDSPPYEGILQSNNKCGPDCGNGGECHCFCPVT